LRGAHLSFDPHCAHRTANAQVGMTEDAIPQAVQELLQQHLTSFEHLEVLLLLHAHAQEDWDVASVSERTRLAPEIVEKVLASLESSELIRRRTRNRNLFRLGPRLPESMDAVEQLAALYRERRAAIMSLMSMQAIERIRSGGLKMFADSFVFKKRNDDG
jgi:DNA-binding MarR family transcriptional regulator